MKLEISRVSTSGALGVLQSAKLLPVPRRHVVGRLVAIGPDTLRIERRGDTVTVGRQTVEAVFLSRGMRSTGEVFSYAGKEALKLGIVGGVGMGAIGFVICGIGGGNAYAGCVATGAAVGFVGFGGIAFIAGVPLIFLLGREKWQRSFFDFSGSAFNGGVGFDVTVRL